MGYREHVAGYSAAWEYRAVWDIASRGTVLDRFVLRCAAVAAVGLHRQAFARLHARVLVDKLCASRACSGEVRQRDELGHVGPGAVSSPALSCAIELQRFAALRTGVIAAALPPAARAAQLPQVAPLLDGLAAKGHARPLGVLCVKHWRMDVCVEYTVQSFTPEHGYDHTQYNGHNPNDALDVSDVDGQCRRRPRSK